MPPVLLLAVMVLMALVAACGARDPGAPPTPTETLSIPQQGEQLFQAKGCATCHGMSAEGSAIAPALPGHSADQVRRQVRSPIGTMPRFGPDRISDGELESLVAFIGGLVPPQAHEEPTGLPSDDAVVMHHWMALTSLTAGDVSEAIHHVRHIIDLVEDPEHAHRMEEVLAGLEAGQLHDAEHEIESMLAGTAEPELGIAELHLQLALGAVRIHDVAGAAHHLNHFIDEASGPEKGEAEEALRLLVAGDGEEAERAIMEVMEGMPHLRHQHDG